jgi:hypothetical protein
VETDDCDVEEAVLLPEDDCAFASGGTPQTNNVNRSATTTRSIFISILSFWIKKRGLPAQFAA